MDSVRKVPDTALLEAWRAGDPAAGDELGRRYFSPIYNFFRSKVPDHADELTQRAFVGCLEAQQRTRPQSSFRAYLFGVARHQLLRHYEGRVDGKRAVLPNRDSIVDFGPSPSRAMAVAQEQQTLLDALCAIPMDFQIVVELFYWQELSTAEIAEVLEVASGTVRSRLTRARAMLREEYDQRLVALGQAASYPDSMQRQLATLGTLVGSETGRS